MAESTDRIGACGLDCVACDLFRLPNEPEIQARFIPWFREQGWLTAEEGLETILAKGMYCKGCMVDASAFWSDGCAMAKCCKQDKAFSNCSECGEFLCRLLIDHASDTPRYQEGIEYLTARRRPDAPV